MKKILMQLAIVLPASYLLSIGAILFIGIGAYLGLFLAGIFHELYPIDKESKLSFALWVSGSCALIFAIIFHYYVYKKIRSLRGNDND